MTTQQSIKKEPTKQEYLAKFEELKSNLIDALNLYLETQKEWTDQLYEGKAITNRYTAIK